MKGPLDPVIYDTARPVESWWQASAGPAPARPALEGDETAEVAIIGGGYAGLSCAMRLAQLGIGALVLDAGEIGWGASGRNGGIVGYGGMKRSAKALRRIYGAEEMARARKMQTDGLNWVREFCLRNGLGPHVQGDAELIVAHSRAAAAKLKAEAEADTEIDWVPPSGQADLARYGGIREKPAFGIHPLRLVRALADAAERAGARIFTRSEVTLWERRGARHRLVTPGGSVTAERVVLATNGFTPDGLHQAFEGRAVPVISNIGVTRPLTQSELGEHPWLGQEPANDTRNLLAYFRLLPDNRFLFGMRGDMRGSEAGAVRMRERLGARLARSFPGWAEAEITHFWRGPICATARLTPAVGQVVDDPSVYHAFGWHGSGINMGNLCGRMIAEVIAGGDVGLVPAPWRGLAPRLPLPGLRPYYVGAAMAGYRVADHLS